MKPMTHKRIIEKELEGFGIRLNKRPPSISNSFLFGLVLIFLLALKRKPKGGVTISKNVTMTHLDDDFVRIFPI